MEHFLVFQVHKGGGLGGLLEGHVERTSGTCFFSRLCQLVTSQKFTLIRGTPPNRRTSVSVDARSTWDALKVALRTRHEHQQQWRPRGVVLNLELLDVCGGVTTTNLDANLVACESLALRLLKFAALKDAHAFALQRQYFLLVICHKKTFFFVKERSAKKFVDIYSPAKIAYRSQDLADDHEFWHGKCPRR